MPELSADDLELLTGEHFAHVAAILLGKAGQHFFEMHDRTPATARQLRRGLHPHLAFLVEQAPD